MIYEFKCQKCGHEQEFHLKMKEKLKESCKKCGASSDNLKRILSAHARMKFNWSKWSV